MVTTEVLFITNLRKRRKNMYRSQAIFAEKVGMSVRGYQKYEQGESAPTPAIMEKFAEALNCESWELLYPMREFPQKSTPGVLAAF